MQNSIRQAPIAFALVLLSAIVFLLFYQFRVFSILPALNFSPFEMTRSGARFSEMGMQWWRFVTPTLIHFGWMHVVFNSLWIWELGRRIEFRLGSLHLTGLFLVSAMVSNTLQFLWAGPSIFGGMSGVVYAMLGFIWVANRLCPNWLEPLPPALVGFMLVWLLVGLTGTLEFVGVGAIANGAHLGGLFIGMLLGAGAGVAKRFLPQ